jgi:hypothetical protein
MRRFLFVVRGFLARSEGFEPQTLGIEKVARARLSDAQSRS